MQFSLPAGYTTVTDDVDNFIRALYEHKRSGGYHAGVARRIGNVIAVPCVATLALLVIGFVRWTDLTRCPALETCGTLPGFVDSFGPPWTFRKGLALLQLAVLGVWWLYSVAMLPGYIRRARRLQAFYRAVLSIDDLTLATVTWPDIVLRLQYAAQRGAAVPQYGFVTQLRLLRHDNYWVALYADGILTPWRFCGLQLDDTRILHGVLDACLVYVCNYADFARTGSFATARQLRRRLVLVALLALAALPGLLPFVVVFHVFKSVEEFHTQRQYMGPRVFSPRARWLLREFNEPVHLLQRRLWCARAPAGEYLAYFVRPTARAVASTVVTVAGFALGVLLCLALYDENILLNVVLWDHNLLWYVGVLTLTVAGARQHIPCTEKDIATDAPSAFARVVNWTHYDPPHWRRRAHLFEVRDAFAAMYVYAGMQLLRELAALLMMPFFLLIRARGVLLDTLLAHLQSATRWHEHAGYVCVYSLFEPALLQPGSAETCGSPFVPLLPGNTLTTAGACKMTRSMVYYHVVTPHCVAPGKDEVEAMIADTPHSGDRPWCAWNNNDPS